MSVKETESNPVEQAQESTSELVLRVVRLGTPAVLENLIVSLVLLADVLMLARLPENTTYLAAISISSLFYWRIVNVFGCTQIGSSALIARRWGEERFKEASFALGHAMIVALIIGVLGVAILWPFVPSIFAVTSNNDVSIITVGTQYFLILLLALPIRLALLTLASGMRAAGDTISPFIIMAIMVVSNIFLNYLLIFGNWGLPRLEFQGAAIGTVLSYLIGLVVGLIIFKSGRYTETTTSDYNTKSAVAVPTHFVGNDPILRMDWQGLRPWFKKMTPGILRVSVGALGEEILITIGFMTYIAMVGYFGKEALAAHSATVRIEALSFTLGWGIAMATSTMVGQALGAGQTRRAFRLFRINTTLAMIVMGAIGASFAVFPGFYLHWFQLDPEVYQIATLMMLILGVEQVFIASGMTLTGGLRGAGETMSPFVAQIFCVIGMRLGFGYLLGFVFGMGITGLYWATALDWLGRTIILAVAVKRGKWSRVEL